VKTNKELTFKKDCISETTLPAGSLVDLIKGEYFINPKCIEPLNFGSEIVPNYSAIHEATYYGFRVNKADIDFN
jgi:hypothetical protein